MVSRLIGATLVGEVRKLKTLPTLNGRDEFDVFYNPQLAPPGQLDSDAMRAFSAWAHVVRRCLLFDSGARTATAATLADQLTELLERHPLDGNIAIDLRGQLVAVRLIDGSVAVGRLLEDSAPPGLPGATPVAYVPGVAPGAHVPTNPPGAYPPPGYGYGNEPPSPWPSIDDDW